MKYDEYYKEFMKNLNNLSTKYGKYEVFLDFLKLASFSMYNSFVKSEDIEKQYLNIVSKYEKEETEVFCKMFGCLVQMYETKGEITDILGEIFMMEKIGNDR